MPLIKKPKQKKAQAALNVVPSASVTDEDMETIFSGPAPFVNKTFVTSAGVISRLTFAEIGAGVLRFRAAVTMTTADLVELQILLNRLLANVQTIEAPKPENDGE